VAERYEYDAWGNVLGVFDGNGGSLPSSVLGLRYLFQGREYSWAVHAAWGGAGLYYFRARWYDPQTGRWLSNDPIGISGGLNQYAFCADNPVMFLDPLGLFWEHVDLYGSMSDMATAGYNRGGISGSVQANFYSGMTALLDVIGGQGVGGTASKSGTAAGEGRTGAAVAWGAGSGALIVMNATTFGRGASAIKNAGKWAANPIKYEVGSGLLPKRIFSQISHLSPVQRGEYLLSNYNSLQRAGLSLWGLTEPTSLATALWGGPTTGGLLGALGLNVYNQYNQDDNCK
jgi:RHS repeat-associated protein